MSNTEAVLRELDVEFEKLVAEMKPLFLLITSKSGQQNVALWLKKLFESTGSTVTEKKNRNMYARTLFEMIQRGTIEGLFLQRPSPGPLPSLPLNMSRRFSSGVLSPVHTPQEIPDWLMSALPTEAPSVELISRQPPLRDPVLSLAASDKSRASVEAVGRIGSNGRGIESDGHETRSSSRFPALDDFSYTANDFLKLPKNVPLNGEENYFRNFDSFLSDASYMSSFHEDLSLPLSVRELVKDKMRNLERMFKENALHQEGQHDSKIKEILDRKNAEILELDEQHKKKCSEAVKQRNVEILRLQHTVSELESELKGKGDELKRLQSTFAEETLELKNTLELKYVKDLQKHKEEVDKELRMVRETDRTRKADLDDFEKRLKTVMTDLKKKEESCRQLEASNQEFMNQNKVLSMEITELRGRYSSKESEMKMQNESHASELRLMKTQSESSMELLNQEHSQKMNLASQSIAGLETEVRQLQRDLDYLEQQKQLELKAKDNESQQTRQQMESEFQLKIKILQQQLQDQEQEASKTMKKLEQSIRDNEEEGSRLAEELAKNTQEMQKNIEENERRTNKLCEDWKQEIEKEKLKAKIWKQKRLKQEEDFRRLVEEMKRQHHQELVEMNIILEQEKSRLLQEGRLQKDQLRGEADAEITRLSNSHQQELDRIQGQLRETADAQLKVISVKDDKLRQMCEEIVQLGIAREEERKKMEQEQNMKVNQIQSRLDAEMKELCWRHSVEVEKLRGKSNKSLKDMESEYNSKIAKANEVVDDLRLTVDQLEGELKRQRTDYENRLTLASDGFQTEHKRFIQQNSSHMSELKKEIEELRSSLKQQDRQLIQQQIEEEEKMTRIRSQYEEKLKGRLPVAAQKEMEDSIASLKSQNASLKQLLHLRNDIGSSACQTLS